MPIHIIAAVGASNHVIGVNGDLPWSKLASDMKHFRDTTMGHPVVMGRKTWDSLPEVCRPLPGRENIVLTRNVSSVKINKGQVIIHKNIDIVLEIAKTEEVFVIGGAEIYQLFMPHAQSLHVTFVHGEFEGDAYFPSIPKNEWRISCARLVPANEKDPYVLGFRVYERKMSST